MAESIAWNWVQALLIIVIAVLAYVAGHQAGSPDSVMICEVANQVGCVIP